MGYVNFFRHYVLAIGEICSYNYYNLFPFQKGNRNYVQMRTSEAAVYA